MKKILAPVSLAVFIAATAQAADTFKSGFKIGVGAGYKRHSATLKKAYSPGTLAAVSTAIPLSRSNSGHSNSALGELHIGYDYIKGKVYSAVELDYRYGPSRIKKTTSDRLLGPALGAVLIPTQVEQKHKHDFGLTGKLGHIIKPNVALYLIGNVRYGLYENKLTTPAAIPGGIQQVNLLTRQKNKLFGYGGGLGCAYAMRNHTSLALDLTYDFYKHSKSKKDSLNTSALVNSGGYLKFRDRKTRIFNAIVKLSKTF